MIPWAQPRTLMRDFNINRDLFKSIKTLSNTYVDAGTDWRRVYLMFPHVVCCTERLRAFKV